ncbi:hypothetical protein ACM0AZ_25025 [Mycobacteroides abscessus subsp. massiliense]|nr:hypothetical protein [Mycobacteroides abscessus]
MKTTNREWELADIPKACGCDREIPDRQIDEHNTECLGCGIVSA